MMMQRLPIKVISLHPIVMAVPQKNAKRTYFGVIGRIVVYETDESIMPFYSIEIRGEEQMTVRSRQQCDLVARFYNAKNCWKFDHIDPSGLYAKEDTNDLPVIYQSDDVNSVLDDPSFM